LNQLLGRKERVPGLFATDMPVIAFACLVVEADQADPGSHEGEPILERVDRARQRGRDLPEHQLGERVFPEGNAFTEEEGCLHVGHDTNKLAGTEGEGSRRRVPDA